VEERERSGLKAGREEGAKGTRSMGRRPQDHPQQGRPCEKGVHTADERYPSQQQMATVAAIKHRRRARSRATNVRESRTRETKPSEMACCLPLTAASSGRVGQLATISERVVRGEKKEQKRRAQLVEMEIEGEVVTFP
jgi:hypothetical protein